MRFLVENLDQVKPLVGQLVRIERCYSQLFHPERNPLEVDPGVPVIAGILQDAYQVGRSIRVDVIRADGSLSSNFPLTHGSYQRRTYLTTHEE